MKPILLLDCNYLAHRAFHAMGKLSYASEATGALFGVLRDILNFQQMHQTSRIAFCFDQGPILRKADYFHYKNRAYDAEQKAQRGVLRKQIEKLRDKILPYVGFKNIFYDQGFEADDVIASVSMNLSSKETGVIISADHDLFQLIRKNVIVWNPNTKVAMTKTTFKDKYGIPPQEWARVKAIAGCKSDVVPGVDGVGEITAAKYIAGQLTKGKKLEAIRANKRLIDRNLKLVKLPYPGTRLFPLREDKVSTKKWRKAMKKLGITSLGDPRNYG